MGAAQQTRRGTGHWDLFREGQLQLAYVKTEQVKRALTKLILQMGD